jgi:enamine deaminase RidA (YjgF/YER057c/UK114 family)
MTEHGRVEHLNPEGLPRNPPLITVAFVSVLAHPDFLAELEAVAVVPQ